MTSLVNPALTTSTANSQVSTDAAVGAGAVAVPVTITGTGFQSGLTITKIVNSYGVADAGVTISVKAVTSTSITALVTIAASDANLSDGYTITNP